MILWMSAEMMADVSDAYRNCRKAIEGRLNALISEEGVLPHIDKWAFIAILREDNGLIYKEIFKKGGRGKILEFRLKVPYLDFREGDDIQRKGLVFDALLRSIDLMAELGVSTEDRGELKDLLLKARRDLIADCETRDTHKS